MTLTLTRRDAVAALIAGGVGVGAPALVVSEGTDDHGGASDLSDADGSSDLTDAHVSTLVALAEVIYPSAVEATSRFVRTYAGNLPEDRRAAVAEAVSLLDDGARRYAGRDFADLAASQRDAVLRRMGVDTVESDPTGSAPARVRYHLVNSLLYALFTTPRGSELVGIQNPTGYPGGYEALTRAPEDDDG